jgi:hypothetical protein
LFPSFLCALHAFPSLRDRAPAGCKFELFKHHARSFQQEKCEFSQQKWELNTRTGIRRSSMVLFFVFLMGTLTGCMQAELFHPTTPSGR